VVTPEAVPISIDHAGLGSRMIASFLDALVQTGFLLLLLLVAAGVGGGLGVRGPAAAVLLGVAIFLIVWGYFPLFEGLWAGQTPGKRAQRLRVVRVDGRPVGFANVLVRNLLRVVDFLPAYYAIGALFVVLTKRSQRLGDLAAGTIVIRERKVEAPRPLDLTDPGLGGRGVDAAGIGEREYALIRSFLERRTTLTPEARAALASQVAHAIRDRVPHAEGGWPGGEEAFLEAVALAYRRRFSAG
jgi:uncharacterized RDD family membrane protein YckC